MAVYREFLGAEELRAAPTPQPTTPHPSTAPAEPAVPVDLVAHEADPATDQSTAGTGGGGDTTMKRTYAIRALLSIASALSAIFLVGGANAKW